MTAGVAQKYVNIQGYLPGKECVILGSGDIGLIMARRMTLEGATVKGVVELMPFSSGLARNIVQCLEDFDIPLMLSHTVTNIYGKNRLEGVDICAVDENKNPVGEATFVPCDLLMLSVGLIPAADKLFAIGAKQNIGANSVEVSSNYETSIEGMFACGNMLHIHDLVDNVTEQSERAGKHAAMYALGNEQKQNEYKIIYSDEIAYTVPSTLSQGEDAKIYFRVKGVHRNARLVVSCGKEKLIDKKQRIMTPGEMCDVMLSASVLAKIEGDVNIEIR